MDDTFSSVRQARRWSLFPVSSVMFRSPKCLPFQKLVRGRSHQMRRYGACQNSTRDDLAERRPKTLDTSIQSPRREADRVSGVGLATSAAPTSLFSPRCKGAQKDHICAVKTAAQHPVQPAEVSKPAYASLDPRAPAHDITPPQGVSNAQVRSLKPDSEPTPLQWTQLSRHPQF